MTVDISPFVQALVALAAAAITAAIPFIVPLLRSRLHVGINADLGAALENAMQAATGAAYKFGVSMADQGGLKNVDVHSAALALAVQYVQGKMPDTLKALGVTPDGIREMVSARLGALLATDPTVTAGAPSTPLPASAAAPMPTFGQSFRVTPELKLGDDAASTADAGTVRLGGYASSVAPPDRGPRVGLPVAVALALGGLAIGMSGCSAQQQANVDTALATPAGALFCAVQTGGGGAVVVSLVNAAVTGAAPAVAPVAVIATNASKAFVDEACRRAGGVPVVPPADPAAAQKIAVVPPPA